MPSSLNPGANSGVVHVSCTNAANLLCVTHKTNYSKETAVNRISVAVDVLYDRISMGFAAVKLVIWIACPIERIIVTSGKEWCQKMKNKLENKNQWRRRSDEQEKEKTRERNTFYNEKCRKATLIAMNDHRSTHHYGRSEEAAEICTERPYWC